MATKAIPVVAAKVPATQTNFPVYIKPSAMTGWGSLTAAEANSIRFYSDSSLTTELAREVVSADEIHVLVPSLSTTTTIYADYDGVRADYAVGATYGRNAVWSNYDRVFHLESIVSGEYVDSCGNANGTSSFRGSSTSLFAASAGTQIGDGGDAGTTSQRRGLNSELLSGVSTAGLAAAQRYVWQCWFKMPTGTTDRVLIDQQSTSGFFAGIRVGSGKKLQYRMRGGTVVNSSANYDTDVWTMVHLVKSADTSGNGYINGGTKQTVNAGTATASDEDIVWGFINRTTPLQMMSGLIDEIRMRSTSVDDDWITTEYNNQSDVGAFWGTVTDVGGGGGPTPNNSARRMLLMGM